MSEVNETVGKRFEKALNLLELSNKELAEKFSKSSQQISNIKKQEKLNDLIIDICKEYSINLNYLEGMEENVFLKNDNEDNLTNMMFSKLKEKYKNNEQELQIKLISLMNE